MAKVVVEVGSGQNAEQILENLRKSFGSVADSVKLLDDTQQRAERRFKATAAALDPTIKQNQEYERTVKTLDSALKRGLTTQDEYNRLLALAKERYGQVSQEAKASESSRMSKSAAFSPGSSMDIAYMVRGSPRADCASTQPSC